MAASIRELADEASFIFEGTLRRTKAVASLSLQPTDEMAVVHVDRILRGPPALAGFKGQEITVELRQPGGGPDLASAYTVSADGKTWTFTLRKGIKWQQGYGEFTCADVAFTWDFRRRRQWVVLEAGRSSSTA